MPPGKVAPAPLFNGAWLSPEEEDDGDDDGFGSVLEVVPIPAQRTVSRDVIVRIRGC